MNQRLLQFLGLARRANHLSVGHNRALEAMKSGKAVLCLIASDASERLMREFSQITTKNPVQVIRVRETMEDIGSIVGLKAGVLTVNDLNFAKKAIDLCSL